MNNASACLRWLAAQLNLEEARQSAALIIADGHRAEQNHKRDSRPGQQSSTEQAALDINEVIVKRSSL